MTEERRCWWCGHTASISTSLPESGGLVRDDGAFDTARETWICADNVACSQRAAAIRVRRL